MTAPHYTGKSAYHGEVAANYERDRVNEPVWLHEQTWMENWAKATLVPGVRVLDVPAGTGRFIQIFRNRGAQVTAVDVSADMLTELRRRNTPDGDSLVVEHGDAEALRYSDGAFDFVVCWRLFHLLPPAIAERVLRELARVSRRKLIIEVLGVQQERSVFSKLKGISIRLASLLKFVGKDSAESTPWAHITSYAHTERALRDLFSRCGLRLVYAETLTHYLGAPARIYHLECGGQPR